MNDKHTKASANSAVNNLLNRGKANEKSQLPPSDRIHKADSNITDIHTTDKYCTQKIIQEPKSKRFNLLIQPTLFKDLEDIAKSQGISVNQLFTNIAKQFVSARENEANKEGGTLNA